MLEKVLFPVIMTDLTEQMIDCLGGVVKNGVRESAFISCRERLGNSRR